MGSESQSFVEVDPKSHFPIQNLPYGIFKHPRAPQPRVGVAIGEFILDLAELEGRGILTACRESGSIFSCDNLNGLMRQGRDTWSLVRKRLTQLLSVDCPEIRDNQELKTAGLLRQS